MKLKFSIILALCITVSLFAQETKPINSNILAENGISPKVLDAAASTLLQDGRFIQNSTIEIEESGKTKSYDLQVIYDPKYKYGKDIRIVVDNNVVSKKDKKELTKIIDQNHSFSRMSRHNLYDESTLKIIKEEGDEIVLEFYYQTQDIEPYLKHIKRLKGNIHINNGQLDKVVLTNFKSMKSNITSYERTVKFEKVINRGGYVVTSIIEKADQIKKGAHIKYTTTSINTKIVDDHGQNITWENQQDATPVLENAELDTISVKLGWVLPLLGKPATKLGYKLPRPIGLDIFTHYQEQTMQFTGLSLAMNDEDFVPFDGLFDIENSTISANSSVSALKADVWILPFLHVMVIAGNGRNAINGNWPLDENFKQALIDYGWLIDIDPEDIPDAITLSGDLESVMYGAGATLAGGVGNWNVSLSYQFMVNEVTAANTTSVAHVFMPMLGYMTPFGMNLMIGGQGQFYDTKVQGFIELDDGQTLSYNVDFEPVRWNAMVGIYKGFAKHWEIALQAGFGKRESVTAVFGYRF
jgi:hypothetical protein